MAESPKRRKTWNKEHMVLAIKPVRQHNMGYKKASKHFGVPKGTLERYVKQIDVTPEDVDSEVEKVTKKVKFNETINLPNSNKTLQKTKKEKFYETTNHPSSNKTICDESDSEVPYNDDSDEEDNDAECLFCTNLYSADTHGEQWVKCIKCYRWAHEHCGAEDANFICPMCEERK
ncbi:unnamed protein product [Psylliodes chrysocephalus]|uniref:HTH psq-type domain-containing protein n=1 Tax=Psylliodes chrysocephalus TaxID=3402493 RepID=A0A9P0CY66_9CUCU|nr:unnamed protein product [Psylliodes chrysocephala]